MTKPIPVSLAKKVVERAIRECDAGLAWTRLEWRKNASEHVRFVLLARAGFRASLEYLRLMLGMEDRDYPVNEWISQAVAPLISHYDATAPGWRAE